MEDITALMQKYKHIELTYEQAKDQLEGGSTKTKTTMKGLNPVASSTQITRTNN